MDIIVNVNNKNLDSNKLYKELVQKQIKISNNKLSIQDIKRINKNLTNSIFSITECSIWNGYITNLNNNNRGTYINFYFKKKKVALHRLLYNNYVSILNNDEYIKYTCINKGKCCNINHMKKYKYNKPKKKNILQKIGDKHLNKIENIIKKKQKKQKKNNSKNTLINTKKNIKINFSGN
jgi:hypothetical protein